MRVDFKTDGGFFYFPDRAPVNIDTADLPAEEADELNRLIAAAGFLDLPEASTPPPVAADYLRYTITVTDSERSHTVQLTDPIEDPDVQALREYLQSKTQ